MVQPQSRSGVRVAQNLVWPERQQGATKMSGDQTIADISRARFLLAATCRQRVPCDGSPQPKPPRVAQAGNLEGKQRRCIVNCPAAHDHADHCIRVHPMRNTHHQWMHSNQTLWLRCSRVRHVSPGLVPEAQIADTWLHGRNEAVLAHGNTTGRIHQAVRSTAAIDDTFAPAVNAPAVCRVVRDDRNVIWHHDTLLTTPCR